AKVHQRDRVDGAEMVPDGGAVGQLEPRIPGLEVRHQRADRAGIADLPADQPGEEPLPTRVGREAAPEGEQSGSWAGGHRDSGQGWDARNLAGGGRPGGFTAEARRTRGGPRRTAFTAEAQRAQGTDALAEPAFWLVVSPPPPVRQPGMP